MGRTIHIGEEDNLNYIQVRLEVLKKSISSARSRQKREEYNTTEEKPVSLKRNLEEREKIDRKIEVASEKEEL